jgi:hypothetical protein
MFWKDCQLITRFSKYSVKSRMKLIVIWGLFEGKEGKEIINVK